MWLRRTSESALTSKTTVCLAPSRTTPNDVTACVSPVWLTVTFQAETTFSHIETWLGFFFLQDKGPSHKRDVWCRRDAKRLNCIWRINRFQTNKVWTDILFILLTEPTCFTELAMLRSTYVPLEIALMSQWSRLNRDSALLDGVVYTPQSFPVKSTP